MGSQDRFQSGNISVTGMELFVLPDGNYSLVVRALIPDDGYSTEHAFVLDEGVWTTNNEKLVMYFGSAVNSSAISSVDLSFTRDLNIYFNGTSHAIAVRGKHLTLRFGPSVYGMDDLTDTLL